MNTVQTLVEQIANKIVNDQLTIEEVIVEKITPFLTAALAETRAAIESAETNLQFWLEHARADGDTVSGARMPSAALTTLRTLQELRKIKSKLP